MAVVWVTIVMSVCFTSCYGCHRLGYHSYECMPHLMLWLSSGLLVYHCMPHIVLWLSSGLPWLLVYVSPRVMAVIWATMVTSAMAHGSPRVMAIVWVTSVCLTSCYGYHLGYKCMSHLVLWLSSGLAYSDVSPRVMAIIWVGV